MINDLVADVITRLRNAQRAGHKTCTVHYSKMSSSILGVLKTEGFVSDFEKIDSEKGKFNMFKVYLKYTDIGLPVITNTKRVSTSGRRMYARANKLPKVHSGLGISIVSTSQGVMTDKEARKKGIGGEILATVY